MSKQRPRLQNQKGTKAVGFVASIPRLIDTESNARADLYQHWVRTCRPRGIESIERAAEADA